MNDCESCIHKKVCDLWHEQEQQDAGCFFFDDCELFESVSRYTRLRELAEADPHWMPLVDAVPVVRCKGCKYRTENGNCGHPRHHGILPSAYPFDFCSYGEYRMNSGGNEHE